MKLTNINLIHKKDSEFVSDYLNQPFLIDINKIELPEEPNLFDHIEYISHQLDVLKYFYKDYCDSIERLEFKVKNGTLQSKSEEYISERKNIEATYRKILDQLPLTEFVDDKLLDSKLAELIADEINEQDEISESDEY